MKEFFRKLFILPIINRMKKWGFMNYHSYYVWGDEKNLINDNPKEWGFCNTIFNTRSGKIHIGKRVMFGHNCMVLTGKHKKENLEKVVEEREDIYIGENTWICSGTIIIGGVRIGKNCIIGAGSIVTQDIRDGVCFLGNKKIKIDFSQHTPILPNDM